MIDWSKLETYQGSKYHSFEELCYQIAKGIYGEGGRFTSVDDSGGGDGVEFYMTLPNGDEWGWQAKFYHPERRLSVSSRKRSIKGSLEKACQTHTHLKKWILCTPSNFTRPEQDWFENTLCQSIPENMSVELEHWGDSDFNAWLSEPRFSGKRNYFFGELELSIDWFQAQFDKQKASVGEKFRSSLHTETRVDAHIHALLGDDKFVRQITEWIQELNEELSDLKERRDNLKQLIPNGIEWDEEEKLKVIEGTESLQDALVSARVQLEKAKELLSEGRFSEAQAIDWQSVCTQLKEVLDTYEKIGDKFGISKIKYTGRKEYEERVVRETTLIIGRPGFLIASLLNHFFQSVIDWYELTNQAELNILGAAGLGKTHTACNICDNRLKTGLPALFIRGNYFTSGSIEGQLRTILDIPSSYSWNDFLQALSAAAEAYHTRIPLIIDGLNESTHNGAFSNVWRSRLQGLVQEIAQTKNIVLITTCRTSYEKAIWGDKDLPNRVYARSLEADEVEQAVDKYFNEYKIKADLTGAPLTQFEHPIYLKIFCESKNRDRKVEKQIYVGEQTLFEVFEEYLNECNRTVCDRLELYPNTSIVQPALNKIAEYLWQNRSRDIPIEKLVHIVDGQSLEELRWSSSKTRAIVDEGLLVCRDLSENGEVLYFTYELLGGYLIAKYLVQHAAEDMQDFLHREETLAMLFSEDHETLHPLHSDIGRCLAALLPAKTGKFLHDFSDNEMASGLSIEALFEISPQYINEDCVARVNHLFNHQQNRERLLKLAETTVGHAKHPFNASFWSKQLLALPMLERDLSWTEYVRHNAAGLEKRLVRFEEACQSDQELSDTSEKRLHLLAEYFMWLLTSTMRPLRDKATRALYWYGRRFPQEFLDLVIKSLSIKDPYVPERMLAATYGTAMARQYDFQDDSFTREMLPLYGRKLYETMFNPSAPHSTTHILARDYARRTIDIALMHHPDLLTDDERKYITPPFTDGGIREWDESKDRNAGEYREGNAPLWPDFENYTLGSLVQGRSNYDFEHNEYKRVRANIFWRIYDLGYSLERFGEIDKWLAHGNMEYYRSADGNQTDRYGQKYLWIAFYELAGFRQDENLLSEYYDDLRISDADIDPSFPVEPQKYNLVEVDFLGDREVPVEEWICKTDPPDLTPYLKIDRLCGEQGPWILLEGHLSQEDDQVNRDMFASVRGLIVKSEESEEIVNTLKQKKIDAGSIPSCPEDFYTYAGEIPWCDTYPANSWEELSFETRSVLRPIERQILLRNGEPISEEETREFFDGIVDPETIEAQLLEQAPEIKVETVMEQPVLLRNGEPASEEEICEFFDCVADLVKKKDWETIEARLLEQDLELTVQTVRKILVPARENTWEAYHSTIVDGRSVAIPCRQIADAFSLCGQPQSFDLFEKDGRRASITFRYGEGWREMQNFTYLRKDLLERYLAKINGELIWVIWGERRQVSQNPDTPDKLFKDVKVYPLNEEIRQ